MNILHLVWGSAEAYGGVEHHVRNLCRFMSERGHPSWVAALPALSAHHPVSPASDSALPLLNLREALIDLIDRRRVDLVMTHNLHLKMAAGVASAVVELLADRGLPHVASVEDVFEQEAAAARTLFGRAAAVITISAPNAELMRRHLQIDPQAVIWPMVDVASFDPHAEPAPRTIAYPARLTRPKGARGAVRLIGYLARELGPLTLLLSDDRPQAVGVDRALVEDLLQDAAAFPGLTLAFNRADGVVGMLRTAEVVMATPNSREGFGMVPAESLASGRPVVALPTGGMAWVREAPGVLVPRSDAIAMAAAVARILANREEWRARALEGRAWVERRFDPDLICGRYVEVCAAALASAQPALVR